MPAKRNDSAGRFAKGVSGNPAGRPLGSRNRATLLMESLLEGQAEQLIQKTLELALSGDINALRLCLDRLMPPRKDRPIQLSLPPIENAKQVAMAMATLVAAIGDGELTPDEGEILANILVAQQEVIAVADVERGMEALDQRISTEMQR